MTQTTTPQIHVIPDPDSVSAILIIEFGTNGSENPPFISCFSRAKTGETTTHHGKIIGEGDCKLFITRVLPSVIIKTMETAHAENPEFFRYFTIGRGFKLIQIASSRRDLVTDEIPILLSEFPPDTSLNTMIELMDNDLIKIFGNNQLPSWARSILDFQLAYWNVHHIEYYYRYMPGRPIGQEFERCIKAAPYWALARWKTELYPHQRNYCMRRSPAGAVAFCIENIPPVRRPWMLASNPDSALRHSFDRLDEKDLAVCVTAAPEMAIAIAKGFSPTSRARLLGSVVKHCIRNVQYRPSALQSEIFDSIVAAPESWLANFDDSFVDVFEKMDRNLAIRSSGDALIALSKKLPPDAGARLLEVVTYWI
jgi:hypothetical protein